MGEGADLLALQGGGNQQEDHYGSAREAFTKPSDGVSDRHQLCSIGNGALTANSELRI
jgi:hypothetical protein